MDMITCVKLLCKERKIPISKLEKDCGFSNGYIRNLKKGILPADKAKIVADYLKVSVDYLMTGTIKEGYYVDDATAKVAQEIVENKELSLLFNSAKDAKPEDLQTVHQMLLALKRKEQNG